MLALEVDENEHKYYDKEDEEIRYNNLIIYHTGRWIFIRWNPHKFTDENGVIRNPSMEERLATLEDEINRQCARILNEENTDLLEVHKLFYSEEQLIVDQPKKSWISSKYITS